MTTNDKPVCWQVRLLNGQWFSFNTEDSAALLAAAYRSHNLDFETRALCPRPADAYPEAAEVCAQAYQVVGSLLSDLGQFGTGVGRKILDNLSQRRLVHDDVLPWPSFTRPADARVPEGWREKLLAEFPLFDDAGLDEALHHCEWAMQQDRKRLHRLLATPPAAKPEQGEPRWFKPQDPHGENPNVAIIRKARAALGPAHDLFDPLDHAATELAALWAREQRGAAQPKPAGFESTSANLIVLRELSATLVGRSPERHKALEWAIRKIDGMPAGEAALPFFEDAEMTPEQCAEWLDAVYRRYGEDEDRQCAAMIRTLNSHSRNAAPAPAGEAVDAEALAALVRAVDACNAPMPTERHEEHAARLAVSWMQTHGRSIARRLSGQEG